MNIAVEATCWHNRRGYGRHARSLLGAALTEASQHQFTFFTDGDPAELRLPPGTRIHQVETAVSSHKALRAGGSRSVADMWRMSRALSQPEFDAVVFPSIASYVPVWGKAARIVFQHDVIAETYPNLTTPGFMARSFWWLKCAAARRQATRLVTVSEYSREKIAARFNWPKSRVAVVGEAAAPVFRPMPAASLTKRLRSTSIDWSRRLVVFVGGFSPHKNVMGLLEVFAEMRSEGTFSDVQVVLVGDTAAETFLSCLSELQSFCSAQTLFGDVTFTGYLPDDDLAVLLNRATVLVLPSLMEGFGLPAVEAAACGCPVIATRESPLSQVLGAGGLYIDPKSKDELAAALRTVLSDPTLRVRMSEQGLAAVTSMNWKSHARDLIKIVEQTRDHRQTIDREQTKTWVRT